MLCFLATSKLGVTDPGQVFEYAMSVEMFEDIEVVGKVLLRETRPLVKRCPTPWDFVFNYF